MPGPHYAISEAFIVFAAIWGAFRLLRSGQWLGAVGIAIFGIAAAIGVYRFGSNQIEELANFHKDFSQIGGSIAMAFVSAQLLLEEPLVNRTAVRRWIVVTAVLASAATALMFPMLTTPLFIAWLSAGIVAAAMIPANTINHQIALSAIVSIFLVNLLLIRQSPFLGPNLSWHAFHVLIAVWVVGMIYVFGYRHSDDELVHQ